MKLNLIFGFLGSGKTTLVQRLLRERARDVKTAVIVNEFGDVGVDGEILRGANVDMVEINSGCLCCTLRGSLMLAVEELQSKAAVERVVVEATGVAQPGELIETLTDPSMKTQAEIGPIVTVVDAARFRRLETLLGDFYYAQIENADIVILNKTDLAPAQELEAVRSEVRELNPEATVLFAEHAEVDTAFLLSGNSALLRKAPANAVAQAHDHASHGDADDGHDHAHGEAHGHGHIHPDSFVLDAAGEHSATALRRMFAGVGDAVWRAKGFLVVDGQPTLLQYSVGQLELTAAAARKHASLVFIGHGMQRESLAATLATYRQRG